jgi:nucleoside-diphosphate-sugar epimerase
MNIILLGYNGYIGGYILKELVQQINKSHKFKIICVGRNIKKKPFKNTKITYVKWDFNNFSKSKLFFFEKKNILINCIGKNSNNSKNLRETNLIFIQKLAEYINKNKISVHFIHLGSVGVYSIKKEKLGRIKNITENSIIKSNDFYSKSKLEADIFIQKTQKINNNKLSYTILRIANVFSYSKNSSAFSLIRFLLKKGIWIKCSHDTRYHFIHAKDVAAAVWLCILNLRISRNKIYIVADDNNQFHLHKIYAKNYNLKLLTIPISLRFLKLITRYFFLPKKILNLFFTISSEINYDNSRIKKELNFKTRYSLQDKII